MEVILLGIDIGTSSCKVTAFSQNGQVVASKTVSYPTYYPAKSYAEQESADWWQAVCHGIQGLLEVGLNSKEIAGIGVAGQSWTCLPVNRDGEPLRRAMIWLDRRSDPQVTKLKARVEEDILIQLSGNPVDPAYITPKILWLQENEPEIYRQTYKFLQSNSYIVFKLTGEFTQEYSQGYGYHFFDITHGKWNEQLANELRISLDLIPSFCYCHEVVGLLTNQAAAETGLRPGIPVVAGGLDAACSSLGAGVIYPGQTQEQGGQAGGMSIAMEKARIHPKLILGYHVLPDCWLLQGGTVGGSGTLKWFMEQCCHLEASLAAKTGKSVFAIMDEEAAEIPPGSAGLIFLPYMFGERSPLWNSKARGVFFGLSYEKTRAHMIRALMEGVGFSLWHNLKTAEEIGVQAKELHSVGGASHSSVWTQIKADITGKVVKVPNSDQATTLGAAILAGVGTGVYRDFSEAVAQTVKMKKHYQPDPERHEKYQRCYNLYLEVYEKLKDCYETLEKLALDGE